MILSILIPSYNYICTPLVRALHEQADKATFAVEIIVMDDASTDQQTKLTNREINKWENCRFIENSINLGRAGIRNQLASVARGELLLFMDCDAGVVAEDFLKNYVKTWKDNCVVCGGLAYKRPLLNSQYSLRYQYGIHIEERSAEKRSVAPYDSFTTFSFLIAKDLFLQIRFDESFKGYGHEDTVFGYELQKRHISVIHIDNPLYHLGLELNEVFLEKTENSVVNLFNSDKELTQNTRLIRAYQKICRYKLQTLVSISFVYLRTTLRKNLLGSTPNLRLFSFYKLGFLCSLSKKTISAKALQKKDAIDQEPL